MFKRLHEIGCSLDNIEPLATFFNFPFQNEFYLVGGALRSALLAEPISDIDLVSSNDPTLKAKQFAESIGASWFWLDESRLQSRVLIQKPVPFTIDFSPFRANDLIQDLSVRDFTINSMAVPLSAKYSNDQIIDPLNGMLDLNQKCLRMTGPEVFSSDPLRIIKGIRHAANLDLMIEKATHSSMMRSNWLLETVAVERIRQEFWLILNSSSFDFGLNLFSLTGTGQQLWGRNFDIKLPFIIETINYCRQVWRDLSLLHPPVQHWLKEEVELGLSRETFLVWIMAFSLIDPDLPVKLAEKWRLSKQVKSRINALLMIQPNLHEQLDEIAPNPRSFSLWLQKFKLDAADSILVAWATRNKISRSNYFKKLTCWISLIGEVYNYKNTYLVSGDWVKKEFGIKPGPELGDMLNTLRDAEIIGSVETENEAKSFLRDLYENKR